jgi:hypothetical protein
MKQQITIDDLTFELRRNRRRTIGLVVERDGRLVITAPNDCKLETIQEFIEEKRFWIYRKLSEKEMLFPKRRPREFVSGEGFPYLGRTYRLKLIKGKVDEESFLPDLRMNQGRFELLASERERGREHFIRWYCSHAEPWIIQHMNRFVNRIDVNPTGIKVRDLGYRWGSCSAGGRLNFHWRVILAPPRIVEYIIVHELVHMTERLHTPKFWAFLERVMPDFPARQQWLAENGAECDI